MYVTVMTRQSSDIFVDTRL